MTLRLGDQIIDLKRGLITGPAGTTRLTTTEQRLLAYLAERLDQVVSRDDLDREVWGHGPQVLSRALDTTVRRLRRKLDENPRNPRYLLTVHGVGYRLIGDPIPRHDPLDRIVELVGQIRPADSRAVHPECLEQVQALKNAIPKLLEQERIAEAVHVCVVTLRSLRRVGPYSEALQFADQVLAADLSPEQRVMVELLYASLLQGKEALKRIDRAENIATSTSDPALLCRVFLARSRGQDDAEANLRKAVTFAESCGELSLMAQACGQLATHLHVHHPQESQRLFLEALKHAQHAEDLWEEAIISGNFAGLLRTLGDLDSAEARYVSTIEQLTSWGDRWSCQVAWNGLGTLRHQRLNLDGAEHCYRMALTLAEQLEQPTSAAVVRINMDCLALDRGEAVDPLTIDVTLRDVRVGGLVSYEGHALANQGVAWRCRGQLGLARTALAQALEVADRLAVRHYYGEYLGELAMVEWLASNPDLAWTHMKDAVPHLVGNPSREGVLARLLLRWASWSEQSRRPWPEEKRLHALAQRVPSVPGTEWEGLDAWK